MYFLSFIITNSSNGIINTCFNSITITIAKNLIIVSNCLYFENYKFVKMLIFGYLANNKKNINLHLNIFIYSVLLK